MNPVQQIRAATAADHETVDAAYGRFDLADAEAYGRFLTAHARALPAVERVLTSVAGLPPLRPRAPLLAADLAALGLPVPEPLPFAPPGGIAAAFGAAYVIEGSRLGGSLLARSVDPALPCAYLSAGHLHGEWRALLGAMDEAAVDQAWIDKAVAKARETFALYREAAAA